MIIKPDISQQSTMFGILNLFGNVQEVNMSNKLMPNEIIESKIYLLRGCKVMLDYDLAVLYDVEIRTLNQSVKRNLDSFPDDFMFQLTKDEYSSLRSQFVTLKRGGHRKYYPYASTATEFFKREVSFNFSPSASKMFRYMERCWN